MVLGLPRLPGLPVLSKLRVLGVSGVPGVSGVQGLPGLPRPLVSVVLGVLGVLEYHQLPYPLHDVLSAQVNEQLTYFQNKIIFNNRLVLFTFTFSH